MHEYKITATSLYAAASIGMKVGYRNVTRLHPLIFKQTEDIITNLDRLSKTPLPRQVRESIEVHTANFGKVKMVVRGGQHFIETSDAKALAILTSNADFKSLWYVS